MEWTRNELKEVTGGWGAGRHHAGTAHTLSEMGAAGGV